KRQEIAAVVDHLDACPRCTHVVSAASAEIGQAAARWPWLAVAAAALLALLAVPLLRRSSAPSVADLVALTPRSARALEPRLSGGFAYAPWRGPVRSDAGVKDAARMELIGAAGALM